MITLIESAKLIKIDQKLTYNMRLRLVIIKKIKMGVAQAMGDNMKKNMEAQMQFQK